jgi:hypothetical protein
VYSGTSSGGGGGVWGTITGTLSAQTDLQSALDLKVPTSRTLTINGVAFDLSANRSWTISSGTVTSVGLTMPSAFSVANSPITSSGTLAVTANGTAAQYIRGDGQLATLPSGASGGSAVAYYLNGSVNQGTIGGSVYYEMNGTPVLGAGTDFSKAGNGLISQFLTDVADPNRLEIPAGAWNFEMYMSASNNTGTPAFYVELLKYDGTTFTSIASSSANPEAITSGTIIDLYLTSLAIPQTTLLATDRLAIRVYIVNSTGGRTITMHTENSHLCEIITNFAGGIAALNGLTANTQYLATGTSGTDFAISSLSDTHTFNLPTASATNRGALSSADWSTFNGKASGNIYTTDGTLTSARTLTSGGFPLTFTGSNTAATAIARGLNLTHTLVAAANNDVLVGLDINPTFTNGAFTGVTNYGLRLLNSQAFFGAGSGVAMFIADSSAIRGDAVSNGTLYFDASRNTTGTLNFRGTTLVFPGGSMTTSDFNITSLASLFTSNSLILRNSGVSSFRLNNTTSATTWYFENHRNAPSGSLEITNSLSNAGLTMFSTRNVGINTNTDAGYQLDVNGTARVSSIMVGEGVNGQKLEIFRNDFGFGTHVSGQFQIITGVNTKISLGQGPSASFTSWLDVNNTGVTAIRELIASDIINSIRNLGTWTDPTAGGGAGLQFAYFKSTTNNYGQGLSAPYGGVYDAWYQVGATNGGGFRWYQGTTEIFRTTLARNFLIGTNTDAGFKLDVNGTARVSGAVTGGLYNGVLVSSRTATQSVFIGVDAGSSATASMAHNVIMGHSAAYSMTTGNWNTIIGRQAATLSATINNSILIGANNLNQYTGTITDVLSFGVASTNVSFVSYPIFGTGIKDASPSFRIGGNNDLALSALPSVTASAILDLTSTTKGFLPPRMTTTQINAIATPAEGLMAYNTTISHLCVYQAGAWAKLSHSPM